MKNLAPSIIRTIVPFIVGAVVTRLAANGVELSTEQAASLGSWLTTGLGGVYYVVVRLLEQHYPQAGWLLGSTKTPTYKQAK